MTPGSTRTAVSAERGLSSAEAALRLRRDGPNELPTERAPSPIVELLRQLTHFFALMLWVAAALAAVAGMPQLAVAIAVVVVINGVFAFLQEWALGAEPPNPRTLQGPPRTGGLVDVRMLRRVFGGSPAAASRAGSARSAGGATRC